MPQKQLVTWEAKMDLLEEALMFDESDGYLQDPITSEIHLVEVKHNIAEQYSIKVNEIDMGDGFTMGEAYDIVTNCVDSTEPRETA